MEDAMLRTLLAGALTALVCVPTALADGPPVPGVLVAGELIAPFGSVRSEAVPGAKTAVEVLTRNGDVRQSARYPGSWGIPSVALDGSTGGLSHDGRTLVLAEAGPNPVFRSQTRFRVLDTKMLRQRRMIQLRGSFAFDALSPNGRLLYVIQHFSAANLDRYVVRAYDLTEGRLLPGRIADRTQRGWVMRGYPVTRVSGANGRWAYTLYQNRGGYPFVHALDTVRGVAHCIGIPWKGDQNPLLTTRLSLSERSHVLRLKSRNGRSLLAIDTRTYRHPQPGVARGGSGFPWWMLGIGLAGALALIGAGVTRAFQRALRTVPSNA
jgi:hypothetical protein